MNATRFMTGAAVLAMGLATLHAQTATTGKTAAGVATVTTNEISGEVLYVEGNTLVGKVQPTGEIRTFNIRPGQQFMIDGQARLINELKPGTVLNATVIATTQPMTVRTTTVTNGTVWYVSGNNVILTLENGENRQVHGPRVLSLHGVGQAGDGVRVAQGHEGVGREDRRSPHDRDLDQRRHHG